MAIQCFQNDLTVTQLHGSIATSQGIALPNELKQCLKTERARAFKSVRKTYCCCPVEGVTGQVDG